MSRILDKLLGIFSNDLAIDLGTTNTCVYVRGRGIILRVLYIYPDFLFSILREA